MSDDVDPNHSREVMDKARTLARIAEYQAALCELCDCRKGDGWCGRCAKAANRRSKRRAITQPQEARDE